MGVNFVDLENVSTDQIPILSLISGNFNAGDQIQIPKDTTGYNIAGWNPTLKKWCTYGRSGISNTEATYTISAGKGFWLKSTAADATSPLMVQIAGKVYDGTPITVTLGQQYTIFSPLAPEDIEINSDKFVWSDLEHGAQVQIPKETTGYNIAGWNSTLSKWCTIGRSGVTTTPVTYTVKTGTSIWVVSTNPNATVSMSSPISE